MRLSIFFNFGIITLVFLQISFGAGFAHAEERTLMHNNQQRHYIIDKPQNVAEGTRSPLIFVLHGGGGNGESAKRMTGFTELAVPRGAIVVYPTGSGKFARIKKLKTWNATHCCGYAMENNVDDVGFIRALIDRLVAHDNADPKRVYVTGMSNGAMMTNQLGAALSDKITAIAPVVGGMFGDEQKPDYPVSALIINGKLDESVPLIGGQSDGRFKSSWDGTPLKPSSYQGTFWAAANGCVSDPVTTQQAGAALTVERYQCPKGQEVERIVVNNGGHAWPGGEQGSRLGDKPPQSLDATKAIYEFFMRQSK